MWNVAYFIGFFVVCFVGWFLVKLTVGAWGMWRDPIVAGQKYIKQSLRIGYPVNEGLIPDEAYKQVARFAYQMAELTHSTKHQRLTSVYVDILDRFIETIHEIMNGKNDDADHPVAKILKEYGVKIPNEPVPGDSQL